MKSTGTTDTFDRQSTVLNSLLQRVVAALVVVIGALCVAPLSAQAETRTLKMYFTHTKESATITFKKNGKYIPSGLKKANRFLRDWRRKEPTKMDPALLDLVWEVYQKSGSRQPIKVISGYRSPRTNNMLRRRGRGVAKTSQHTKGKALDFFLPDVSVAKLRALGLKAHRGGVGYYRGSFVHLDTGRVRHWPRMSSKQLKRVFPKGRTIHVPSNGKPLKGYKIAKANLKKGLNADGTPRTTTVRKTLLASLFNNNGGANAGAEEGEARNNRPQRPVLNRPVPVAALPTRAARPAGPDPLAQENAAARANEAEVQRQQIALSRIAVPKLRPQSVPTAAPAPDTVTAAAQVPSVAELNKAVLASVDASAPAAEPATQLAVATPDSPPVGSGVAAATGSSALRPAVDVPNLNTSQDIATSSDPEVSDLKARIETALARGRTLTPAEQAAELQSNSQLAQALQRIPVPSNPQRPTAAVATVAATTAKATALTAPVNQQLALAQLPSAQPTPLSPALVPVPETKPAVAEPAKVVAAAFSETTTPSWRTPENDSLAAAVAEKLRVPLPVTNPNGRTVVSSSGPESGSGSQEDSYTLSLGDLDGSSVKEWAVSSSTRVGPSAILVAPDYKQGSRLAAPNRVYSAGFAQSSLPLRADRFSGRSLTRVAFATFDNQ
ncbi:MAG: DUF882 domain-containing protein [Rhizobiaceae bacterium]